MLRSSISFFFLSEWLLFFTVDLEGPPFTVCAKYITSLPVGGLALALALMKSL